MSRMPRVRSAPDRPSGRRDLAFRVEHDLEHLIVPIGEDLVSLRRLVKGKAVGEDVVAEVELALLQVRETVDPTSAERPSCRNEQ